MEAFFSKLKPSLFLFLFYAVLATAFLSPLSTQHAMPAIVDYSNHIASIIEAKKAFAEGQFPLRIAPTLLSGWRYPSFQFYSPTTYTLAGLIYQWFSPKNPIIAVNLTLWLGLVLGGFFMQRLAFWFVKSRTAALLAGVVYLTAPYYLIVINGLGNLCETLALGIVPAVLYYSLKRFLYPRQNKTLLQTSLAWYLLVTIHMITFVYTAIFTFFLFFLISCKNKHHWKNFIELGIGMVFACLLAMWYLAPIALLQKYLIIHQTFVNPYQFQSFAPSLSNLLFPSHLSFQGTLGSNHVAIGLPIVMAAGICIYALFSQARISSLRANYWLPYLLLLFFLIFMVIWSPFSFLGWIPHLFLIGQYCWRLLGQLLWVGAILFAWAVCWLFKNKLDFKQTVIGVLLLILTASVTFPKLYDGFFTMNLDDFVKQPYFIFNPDAYTIEFNKQTGFIDHIDTLQLSSLMINNTLQLNTIYVLTPSLMHYAKSPRLLMEGTVPASLKAPVQLNMIVNDVTFATYKLRPGKFQWEIPLNTALHSTFKDSTVLKLQFKTNPSKSAAITINDLSLAGFLTEPDTFNVKKVQPFCHQDKITTQCKLDVPLETQLLELPILYYPKLLQIKLNGKIIPYQGIVYQNNLIVGIKPIAGQHNTISIQFTGLMWANSISWLSWILWIVLLIYMVFLNRYCKTKKFNLY